MIDILPPEFHGTEEEQLEQIEQYLKDLYDVLERKLKNIDLSDLNYDLAERLKRKPPSVFTNRKIFRRNTEITTYKNMIITFRGVWISELSSREGWSIQVEYPDKFLLSFGVECYLTNYSDHHMLRNNLLPKSYESTIANTDNCEFSVMKIPGDLTIDLMFLYMGKKM